MYKSLFISDTHLGSSWNNSAKLFKLLEHIEAEQLFLVGDIINTSASKEHPEVLMFITLIQKKKWNIVYVAGNNEDERGKRPKVSLSFNEDFFSKENHIYRRNETSIYLEHGHRFHSQGMLNRLLHRGVRYVNGLLYLKERKKTVTSFNGAKKRVRVHKENVYHRYLKPFAQKLLRHSFKSYISSRAKEKGCSVVICGHFHIPEDSMVGDIRYLNCGDWVKSSSYIVENQEGEFTLLKER